MRTGEWILVPVRLKHFPRYVDEATGLKIPPHDETFGWVSLDLFHEIKRAHMLDSALERLPDTPAWGKRARLVKIQVFDDSPPPKIQKKCKKAQK